MATITTLLIANRGEIARRIMRTARNMGIRTVAVYSEPDRDSPHVGEADVAVALGGSTAADTYLRVDKLLGAARATDADAVHPGYGFLSENAAFATACVEAGLIFVGPTPENIRAMGDKIEAKRLAVAAGVPTLPSALVEGDDAVGWASAASTIGYPLLVKASAGGGGRGMRIVRSADEMASAITSARREASDSFGDGTVFLERYLEGPRHIEIQVLGDAHGNVVHLFERECSVQRRHQKIIEEAPSPALDDELRQRMCTAAVTLARSILYVGAGTVEFVFDDTTREFFFLEMNTRLQVEHPVTEAVTHRDLVAAQIQIAQGWRGPSQEDIHIEGHAIEVRVYAEDPANDFLPTFGTLEHYDYGPGGLRAGARFDDGVRSGSVISTFYDPMLSKIIAWARPRERAAAVLRQALAGMAIHGVVTNRDYLVAVLGDEDFLAGRTTTAFVDAHPALLTAPAVHPDVRDAHIAAATLVGARQRRTCDRLWSFAPAGWRNVPSQRQVISYTVGAAPINVEYAIDTTGDGFALAIDGREVTGRVLRFEQSSPQEAVVVVEVTPAGFRPVSPEQPTASGAPSIADESGVAFSRECRVRINGDRTYVNSSDGQTDLVEVPRFADRSAAAAAAGPMAPVPGRVVAVHVKPGDHVEENQVLVLLEAMKMEHRITAATAGIVREVLCAVGDQVDAHQVLVALA